MPKKITKLEEVMTFLKREDLYKGLSSYSFEEFKLPFEIVAQQFLEFAEQDLLKSDDHSVINALSNIKRGIDCRVDSLLVLFSVYEKSKKERWGFPAKVSFLKEVGLLAPRVLERINTKRNKLEHEYKILTQEEAEDALDVAKLFIESTNPFLNKTVEALEWELDHEADSPPWIRVELKSTKGYFKVELFRRKEGKDIKLKIDNSMDAEYKSLLRDWVSAFRLG